MEQIKNNWHKGALLIILALTGFLSFYSINNEGYANQYYSAAVKSMLTSWHNFFFASFDAGGYVTVDKPALGLWLQALSSLIFGFHGWSLILPEALSAVVSTALMYIIVKRFFGRTSGIISALIFGFTPILIAVSRTNNFDSSLVMVLLFAAWALIKAAEKGSLGFLLLSLALVGLGFNIKMLQAYMVLPAFVLVYILTAPINIKKRVFHLTGAGAVLIAVSLSWALIVDLTPADTRPYVGGSKTNSVIELALGYNGIQRITGSQSGRDGDSGGRMNGQQGDSNADSFEKGNAGNFNGRPGGFDGGLGGDDGGPGGFGMNNAGGPGGEGENGQKGLLRIFNEQLAGQISWMLPMALFGILALILKSHKYVNEKKMVLRHLLLWVGWIAPMLAYFSIAGFFHRYYLVMLAPGMAALAGAGMVEMWKAYKEDGWKWILLPSALLSTAGVQSMILTRYTEWRILIYIVFGLCILGAGLLVVFRILNKNRFFKPVIFITAISLMALLIAPAVWAYSPIAYGSNTTLPVAGPELKRGLDFGIGGWQNNRMGPQGFGRMSTDTIKFLLSKKQGEKFLVAVADANLAAPIILETGEAVMAVGGFSGTDDILSAEMLEKMVKAGEIRYFQLGFRGMGQQSEITRWVMENGKLVSDIGDGNLNKSSLYDLAPDK